MRIFTLSLVRHGETKHNKERVIQGQLDVPLSDIGVNQAKLLGNNLSHQHFTHVYSSDLSRARETAEEIMKHNLVSKTSIVCDPRLRERKFGELQGKPSKLLKDVASKSGFSIPDYIPPGGESVSQVHERAISFFQSLCQDIKSGSKGSPVPNGEVSGFAHESEQVQDDECHCTESSASANVLIVSHGGLILEMMKYFTEDLHCKFSGKKSNVLHISPNAGISKFSVSVNEDGIPEEITCLYAHKSGHENCQSEVKEVSTAGGYSYEVSL